MTVPHKPLKVCIDARLVSGESGGIEQYVVGLASGLSRLHDGNEEYLFLVFPGHDEWLFPFLEGPCRRIESKDRPFVDSKRGRIKRAIPFSDALLRSLPALPGLRRAGPKWSDGTIENSGVQVMHFPGQHAFFTDVSTVYQPQDLQHLHLPHLFSPRERYFREETYRAHCVRATAVAMLTSWGARDVVDHYKLAPEKVVAIPPGASMASAVSSGKPQETASDSARLETPESFLLYPAQTWPHKNHIRLIEALALVRDAHGVSIPVVCTGAQNSFYPSIVDKMRELHMEDQLLFTGFVEPAVLEGLYRSAVGMIFPSLFEGWGMPITEAFSLGLPVVCSDATSLPDLVQDAALVFDPLEIESIANAALTLWSDASLRERLAERGSAIAAGLSWDRTAVTFRALYRRISGRDDEIDRRLLAHPVPV